jgi:hypothetical protein
MEADPQVEDFVVKRLEALGIDSSYANYTAAVIADSSLPEEEKKTTLMEMLTLCAGEENSVSEQLEAMLNEAILLQLEQDALNSMMVKEEPVEPKEPVVVLVSAPAPEDFELDLATKKAIAMQYGYIEESEDSGDEKPTSNSGKPRSKRKDDVSRDKVRAGKLDSALTDLEVINASAVTAAGKHAFSNYTNVIPAKYANISVQGQEDEPRGLLEMQPKGRYCPSQSRQQADPRQQRLPWMYLIPGW